jgi:hypothetical protein
MSHTDKTDPTWVQALHASDREVRHHYACKESPYFRSCATANPCDLNEKNNGRCRVWSYAVWLTIADRPSGHAKNVRLYYTGPERANMRTQLVNVRRDYNANGDVYDEPVTRQHRHATFAGGWWT